MAGITETRDNERHTEVGISNRERVLVVNDCVSEGSSQLLARGPAFVFSTGVTTTGERSEVETAVERMAFTLRWQASKPEEIELQQPTEDRLDSKLHRLIPRGFKQPLPGTPEDELCLSNFKRDVLAVYDNFKPSHSRNITKEDRQELRNLKQKADMVIKPSDKSKKLVAMPKQEYVQKAEAILADNGMYEPVNVTISSLEKRTREIIASECSGMDSKLRTAIMPSDTRFPEWYGLPKDHKQNLPLRPVVSACDSPTTALSIVLERILNQLLQFAPAHLKNTTECLSNIKQVYPNLCAPEGTILVTMDVVGLYPSIPITEGIQVVIETLQDHAHEIDMLGLSVNSIENLLQYVLTSNYFRFGSGIYRQVEGVAMGNNLAPPFAILFMNAMESRQLSESPESPICYRRYIDDIFFMWTHGQAKLKEFVNRFNTQHERIKFTYETSELTGRIDYMDVTIAIDTTGNMSFQLYQKPCSSGLLIDYYSAVPRHVKLSVAKSQFLRAKRLSSDVTLCMAGEEKIHHQLLINHYPEHVIEEARQAASKPHRRRFINPHSSYLKLPFNSDQVHRQMLKLIRKYKFPVRIVYEHRNNLASNLCRSAFEPLLCVKKPNAVKRRGRPSAPCITCSSGTHPGICCQKGVVYELLCHKCGESYIGETGRTLETRVAEHCADARKGSLTPWGQHYQRKHRSLAVGQVVSKVKILARESDRASRKLREAVEIKARKPAINMYAGWNLL